MGQPRSWTVLSAYHRPVRPEARPGWCRRHRVSGAVLGAALAAIDSEALRRAGTSVDQIRTGFNTATISAINDVDALASAVERLGVRNAETSRAVSSSLDKALEVASTEQQMNAFTSSLDINHKDQGKFRAAAYDAFNTFLSEKKRKPNFEERATIMAKLNEEIVTKPGFLWDTKDPAYKADPEVRRKALAPPPAPAPKGSPTASMIGIMAPAADAYVKGKVYVDAKGNRATYQGGGKWTPAP